MSALDDIKAALDSINKAAEELGTPASPSVGDTVLEAVVNCLKENGYTVTPPAEATESTTDTPSET